MVRSIGNVQKDGQVRAVASGALTNGAAVVVNADGTVSVVAETNISQAIGTPVAVSGSSSTNWFASAFDPVANKVVVAYLQSTNLKAVVGTISGTSISFGTAVNADESCQPTYVSAAFDSNSNKVVIAYNAAQNTPQGLAVVGTVNGTSISFGTPVQFDNTVQFTSTIFDSNSNKVLIAYMDDTNSDYGTAIVGTVSGTSISFGSATIFESAKSVDISCCFDSSNNKVVIAYRDQGNSFYGTAVVGTISGTSVSFGTPVVFYGGTNSYNAATFDSSSNKVVIAWQAGSNSNHGRAIVGTVSGTSITFGSSATFESAKVQYVASTFDSNANKVVISYRDDGNSNYGTLIVGTVSGTSISFGTAVVYETATTNSRATAFDSVSNKVFVGYQDDGNSQAATGVVFQNASADTNLTSENYIGFADGAYADTQSAVINTTCSVDRSQTSLTAGQKYYVQTNGSLGLTAADPSVEAGTAISATEILVKG